MIKLKKFILDVIRRYKVKKGNAVKTTLYLDAETYTDFKILAVKLNKSVSELVEQFMKQEISNGK
jgi:hypothetical protein